MESCTQTQLEASLSTLHSCFCFHPWLQAGSPACSESLWCPYSSMLTETNWGGSGGTWICLRGKRRAETRCSPQDRTALAALHGLEVFPVGMAWTTGAPYSPSAAQHCAEQELLGTPAAKPQLQRGSRDGYPALTHQQCLLGGWELWSRASQSYSPFAGVSKAITAERAGEGCVSQAEWSCRDVQHPQSPAPRWICLPAPTWG